MDFAVTAKDREGCTDSKEGHKAIAIDYFAIRNALVVESPRARFA